VQQEVCEQGAQPLSIQRDSAAVLDDRQRAENAEFDGNMTFVTPLCPED
jgi:hypothetical protein